MLIAPTEAQHPALRALGRVSSTPERCGVDFLFATRATGTVGIQRKAFPADFLASINDGRLSKEVAQMQVLDVRVLLVEGRGTWTTDGKLIARWGQHWTRAQHRSFLWSMRAAGVWVEWSDDVEDTARVVRGLETWARKAKHTSLARRPGAKGAWGKPTNREYLIHLVMGLPGVGPELAERIVDTLGMPFGWAVTVDDLVRVHGIGRKKAEQIYACLEPVREARLEPVREAGAA